MCGIVGIIAEKGVLSDRAVHLFEHLLYHDTIRGPHSTGVMAWASDNICWHHKEAVPGPEFLEGEVWKDLRDNTLAKNRPRAIIGHNRWATVGEINAVNAHPFKEEVDGTKLLLVHNGTLDNGDVPDALLKEKEVDSRALTHMMAKAGDGFTNVLEDISGAWSLAWFNLKAGSLYVGRNAQRPLATATTYVGGNKVRLYASEYEMLDWILQRTKAVNQYSIEKVPTHSIAEFSMSGKTDMKLHKITPKERYTYDYGSSYAGGYSYPKYPRSSASNRNGSGGVNNGGPASGIKVSGRTFPRAKDQLFLPFHFESQGNKGRLWGHVYDDDLNPLVDVVTVIYAVDAEKGQAWCDNDTLLTSYTVGKTQEGELILNSQALTEAEGYTVDTTDWSLEKKDEPIIVDINGNAFTPTENSEDTLEFQCDWCSEWVPDSELTVVPGVSSISVCEDCLPQLSWQAGMPWIQ